MKKNKKAIAILGGMGPEASGYAYKLLIDLSLKEFNAKNNDDFPEIYLYSIPVPDFISSDKNREKAFEMLTERVEAIPKTLVGNIGIACNTAHVLLPELQKATSISFISMLSEVAEIVQKKNFKKVGIIGTPSTMKYKLYQKELDRKSIQAIMPDKKEWGIVENAIRNVIAGKSEKKDVLSLTNIADRLKKNGAEAIILGCTELPLVFPSSYTLPIINSLEVLSRSLLQKYYHSE